MKIDFLHIGFMRCGSSFLFQSVYPLNPHLECTDADGPHRALGKLLFRDFVLADGFEYDRQSFESKFTDICQAVFTNGQAQRRGILFRPFTYAPIRRFDRKNVIDRINDSFPEVKIIMSIRSQPTWITSFYSLWLANGGVLGLHDFIESIFNNEHLVAHYIDWFPLVSYLYKLFGSERVLICLYEELQRYPQAVANRLSDFLEVPHVQVDESPVQASNISKEIVPLRRFLNHLVRFGNGVSDFNLNFYLDMGEAKPGSKISKSYNTFVYKIYKPYTDQLCRIANNVFRFKGRFELEERHLKMIEQRYSSNNKKLSELLNVDLSGYGYP